MASELNFGDQKTPIYYDTSLDIVKKFRIRDQNNPRNEFSDFVTSLQPKIEFLIQKTLTCRMLRM